MLRPTGRQLFERDASLYDDVDVDGDGDGGDDGEEEEEEEEEESDEDEEGDAGVADAALFQDLGDEDLPSDSDEDDPDYKP
jgi:hypothetical protein